MLLADVQFALGVAPAVWHDSQEDRPGVPHDYMQKPSQLQDLRCHAKAAESFGALLCSNCQAVLSDSTALG